MREIVDLKDRIAELTSQREADHTLMASLRSRLEQLEAELCDYKEIAEQTCNVCEWEGKREGGREGGVTSQQHSTVNMQGMSACISSNPTRRCQYCCQ